MGFFDKIIGVHQEKESGSRELGAVGDDEGDAALEKPSMSSTEGDFPEDVVGTKKVDSDTISSSEKKSVASAVDESQENSSGTIEFNEGLSGEKYDASADDDLDALVMEDALAANESQVSEDILFGSKKPHIGDQSNDVSEKLEVMKEIADAKAGENNKTTNIEEEPNAIGDSDAVPDVPSEIAQKDEETSSVTKEGSDDKNAPDSNQVENTLNTQDVITENKEQIGDQGEAIDQIIDEKETIPANDIVKVEKAANDTQYEELKTAKIYKLVIDLANKIIENPDVTESKKALESAKILKMTALFSINDNNRSEENNLLETSEDTPENNHDKLSIVNKIARNQESAANDDDQEDDKSISGVSFKL